MSRAVPRPHSPGKLTGRKVALIFFATFGVFLAANVVLLVNAVGSFSGLVVPNSYVASQSFDRNRDAQQVLGWQIELAYEPEVLRLVMRDAHGAPVRPERLQVVVGRPTSERDDVVLDLQPTPSGYAAAVPLAPGAWRVDITARATDGTDFVQYRSLWVGDR
jgi:nitrogen fixation protein FixH